MSVDTLLRKEKDGTLYKRSGDHHKIAEASMDIAVLKAAFEDELSKIAAELEGKATKSSTEVLKDINKKFPELAAKTAAESKAHKFLHGMGEETAGAIGMTLGAGIGNMYGHPLQGAGLGYGIGAGADWAARSLAARMRRGK